MSLFALLLVPILACAVPDLAPPALGLERHPPDLWAVVVVYLALRGRGFRAVGWAIALGAVRDAASLDPLGTHAFTLGLTAFVFCEGRVPRSQVEGAGAAGLAALGVLAAAWIHLLRILPLGGGVVDLAAFGAAFPVALASGVLAAGLFPLLDRFGVFDDLCGRHGRRADLAGRKRAFPA
jgi:hypothetical protein